MDRSKFSTSRAGSNSSSRSSSRMGESIAGTSKFSLSRASKSYFGSKSNLYSGSRRGLHSESEVKLSKTRIYNEKGEDVTPKPLIGKSDHHMKRNQSDFTHASDSQQSSTPGNASFMQTYRSVFSTGGSTMDTSGAGTGSMMGGSIMSGSFMGSGMEGVVTSTKPPSPPIKETIPEEEIFLTSDDLDKLVNVTLTETDTIWILDIPSTWVAPEAEDIETIQKNNEAYQELCRTRPGNDRYSERGMQTFNEPPKSKHVQTDEIKKRSVEVYASDWEREDTLKALGMSELNTDQLSKESSSHLASHLTSHLTSRATSRIPTGSTAMRSRPPTVAGVSMGAESTLMDGSMTGSSIFEVTSMSEMSMYSTKVGRDEEEEKLDPTKPNDHPILKLESLRDSLRVVERAVTENIYQNKQAKYRDLPILPDPDGVVNTAESFIVTAPHLTKLWGFKCPMTQGRPVTCIAWNPSNKDIFAAGYGDFNMTEDSGPGLICCWSLKNPEYPERFFYAPSGVTSLSFSHHHPNILAVGLYSGHLVLYNCRSTSHEPVMTSRDALFKHSGPVWQIDWIVKERTSGENTAEVLASIGVDGRILQWTIRKGFESLQLMKLKRMLQSKSSDKKLPQSKSKILQQQKLQKMQQQQKLKSKQKQVNNSGNIEQQEAYISQHAPGIGFDFWESDTNIYLVTTEEGHIHKCSCSYNEQFLETYSGHMGPVYKVLWHPLNKDLFLSCSSDWSIRLWHQDKKAPLHSFQVTQRQDSSKPTQRRRQNDDKSGDQSSQDAVWCIDWCPYDQTMFACVRGARIEIWNMKHNVLDPLIVYKPVSGCRQTYLQFSRNSDVILVGDNNGEVSVYFPRNLPPKPENQYVALQEVLESLENPTKR